MRANKPNEARVVLDQSTSNLDFSLAEVPQEVVSGQLATRMSPHLEQSQPKELAHAAEVDRLRPFCSCR